MDLVKHYIFDIDDKSITSSSLTNLTEYNEELYIGSEGDEFLFTNDSTGLVNTESGLLSNNVKNFLKHISSYLFLLTRE